VQLKCTDEAKTFLESQRHHIKNLVVTKSMEFVPALDTDRLHVEGATRLAEFSLILEDVIDVGVERRRLTKEKERALKEIANAERRLQDERFLTKAPAEIVEGVRRKLSENTEQVRKIDRSLDKLPSGGNAE
jgi:valyl-tRNA synthetase